MPQYDIYSFHIEPTDALAAEILTALLAEQGFDSFEETDEGINAYVSQDQKPDDADIDRLVTSFPLPDRTISYTVRQLENKDWNEQWENNGFEPIVIPGLCVIHTPEQTVDSQPYDIFIRPRMAFGSGTHETTSQLVQWLLSTDFTGRSVLDMGCGTGILAICMALRHAAHVTAIDIDEASVDNTELNASLNQITGIQIIHGDAGSIPATCFDFIVANIHRNIIIADLPTYVSHLAEGGQLAVSGFFTEDIPAIATAAKTYGLQLVHQQECNNWAVLIFQR